MTEGRLPPNQRLAAPGQWPSVGEREPAPNSAGQLAPDDWSIEITGLVNQPTCWTLGELKSLPIARDFVVDIHCVTRWSMLDAKFRGVLIADLLQIAQPSPQATYLSFVAHSPREHTTSLPLADTISLGSFVAWDYEGQPITSTHGGPLRHITPGRYFYKSVKWIKRIEVLAEDRLGYWENDAGYHNHGDPWKEERYITSSLDRLTLRKLLDSRDFSDQNLLSLQAMNLSLCGLNASKALLRNADFSGSTLCDADFTLANLSNANLMNANLLRANFSQADLEGAQFEGADLRGATLIDCSLFGTTFVSPINPSATVNDGQPHLLGAIVDATTRISRTSLDRLITEQSQYLVNSGVRIVE